MKPTTLTPPELGMIAGTRAMIGAGLGLLLADRMTDDNRRTVGWTLLAVGALSTIPLAADVLMKRHAHGDNGQAPAPALEEARFKI